MRQDPIAALIGALDGLQARVALSGDRALLREMISADATHMLADVPPSARSVLISAQVEGRMQAVRRGHRDAVTLILNGVSQTVGMMTLDWPSAGPVMLLDLLVLPTQRGQGVGTQALTALCAVATHQQRPVRASLFYDSPARRLLTRAGFAPVLDAGTEIILERDF